MFNPSLSMIDQAIFLVVALLGFAACFFGCRLLRLWLALAGLLTGFYLISRFGGQILADPVHRLIVAGLCGVVLAGLFSILVRVGGFLAGAGIMALLADQLLRLLPAGLNPIALYVFLAAMLLGGLLGILQVRAFLMPATAFAGGWLASFAIAGIILVQPVGQAIQLYDQLQGPRLILVLVSTGVLFILGTMVQVAMNRKNTGRKVPVELANAAAGQFTPVDLALPTEPPTAPPEDKPTEEKL
jgi:hypothetical protein